MTAAVESKKKNKKAGDNATVETLDNGTVVITEVDVPPASAEPGEAGYDWQADYPGEKVFTYTTPADTVTTKGEPYGDVTIGLAAISEKRQPDIGFLWDNQDKPEFDQVLSMAKFITCDAARTLLRPLPPVALIGMFEKWSDWNRTNAGK